MRRPAITWPLCALALAAGNVLGQQGPFPGGPVPLEVTVVSSPKSIFQDGTSAVLYELVVANPTVHEFTIDNLEITVSDGARVTRYEGPDWNRIARRLPAEPYVSDEDFSSGLPMGPGTRYLLYLWLDFPDVTSAPDSLSHEFALRWRDGESTLRNRHEGPFLHVTKNPIVVDPPVRGGMWWVSNGFTNVADHRRFFVASGEILIAQRFGADFIKLARDGLNAAEGPITKEAFHAFREPLYAVADGTVVSVRRDLDDLVVGEPTPPLEWDAVSGNHVILQIEPGVYALYAHLSKEDVDVEVGQRVVRGDRIGSIGNSGNTMNPHVHFHLMDRPSPNESSGVPFVFRSFELLVEDYGFRDDQRPLPTSGRRVENSAPIYRWVIRLPD